MATIKVTEQSTEDVEVTVDYCYEQSARCLAVSYQGRDVQIARAWRELGDSILSKELSEKALEGGLLD